MTSAPTAAPITHYENFPVASWLCPPALRPPIASIYHFARTADDLADEGNFTAPERLAQLQRYRLRLEQASQSPQANPLAQPAAIPSEWPEVFAPLAHAIATHQLPQALLDDLLKAFEQDVRYTAAQQRHTDRDSLLAYCNWSANPVGRLLLHLYGVNDATSLRQSDAICSALQLINFWQDLSQDIPRGRHYITLADQRQFGLSDADIQALRPSPAMGALVADLCRWTRELMTSGAPLVHTVPGRAGWELRAVVQGGLRMLDAVEALGAQAIAQRIKLRKSDWLHVAWRSIRM